MSCCLLTTALVSSVPARAQETDANAAAQEQAAETEENDDKARAEREPTPEELTPDTFDPTEKVSEDLPVAFPVDI